MRSVHPTIKPLVADHHPKADCPSCHRVWLSGDKKVRFAKEEGSDDDDDSSEYDTADEGESYDEEEEDEVDEDEDEIHEETKILLKWRNRRTEIQGLLI